MMRKSLATINVSEQTSDKISKMKIVNEFKPSDEESIGI